MFGKTSYRYPKITMLLDTIKDLIVPYILQAVVILRWTHLLYGQTSLLLISTFPCITVAFFMSKMMIYYKMYDIACRDITAQQILINRPDIDKEDYLLWTTMEAFILYQAQHYEELQTVKQRYVAVAYASVLLQALFAPVL